MTIFVTNCCIGCGLCSCICPGLLTRKNRDSGAELAVTNEQEEQVREAQRCCPVDAIVIKGE